MKLNICFALLALAILSTSCESEKEKNDQKAVQEIRTGSDDLASILRHPVSMEGIDTVNVAKLTFENDVHNFGEIKEGEVVRHKYKFKNTGKVPLVITDARSTCGCTVPEYSEDAIPPGGSGEISVKFDSNNKSGAQDKPITITANTYPSETVLKLRGIVSSEK